MQVSRSIALLHGWATDPRIWKPVTTALEAEGFDVTVYEMSGYGSRKEDQPEHRTIDWHVLDAIEKLGQCQIWVGWSLGAILSLAAAAGNNSKLKGLIVVSGTAKFCHDQSSTNSLLELKKSVASNPKNAVRRFASSMPAAQHRRRLFRKLTDHAEVASKDTLLLGLELLSRADLSGKVNKIGIPVAIVSGSEDAIIPAQSGLDLHQQVPNSQFTTLPCGHIPFLECPEAFMEQLLEFAETIAQSQTD